MSIRVNKRRGTWTPEEDEALIKAVKIHGAKNWKKIAENVPGRTYVQCLHRWQKVLNPTLVKGPWTEEEDRKVIELVKIHGPRKWELIASHLPGRIGKQCRERWKNHLDPSIKKGNWETHEDELILELQSKLGNKWATIAKYLPGRTDNAVKNRFNSTLSRRLRQQHESIEENNGTINKNNVSKCIVSGESSPEKGSIDNTTVQENKGDYNINNSYPVNISLYHPVQNFYYFFPGMYDNNKINNYYNFESPVKENEKVLSPPGPGSPNPIQQPSILRKRKAQPLSHSETKKAKLSHIKREYTEDQVCQNFPQFNFGNKENIPPENLKLNRKEHNLTYILNEDTPKQELDQPLLKDTGEITLKVLQQNNEQYEGIKEKAFKLLSRNL